MAVSQYDTIGSGATFTPLTSQEIWTPMMMLREQHDKAEEQLAAQEASGLASLNGIDPNIDAKAYAVKQNYVEQARKAANDLMSKGYIDSGRRRNLNLLRSTYNTQILPYEQALASRRAKSAEYQKMMLENPDFITSHQDPSTISLDAGLTNPNAYDFNGIRGNVLQKSVADKVHFYANSDSADPKLRNAGLAFKYLMATKKGAALDEIYKAQQAPSKNDTDMTRMLRKALSDTLNEYGVYDKFGNSGEPFNRAFSYAASGLTAAAGSTNYMQMEDELGMYKYKKSLEQQSQQAPNLPTDTFRTPFITDSSKYKEYSNIISSVSNGSIKYRKSSDILNEMKKIGVKERLSDKKISGTDLYAAGTGAPVDPVGERLRSELNYSKLLEKLGKQMANDPEYSGIKITPQTISQYAKEKQIGMQKLAAINTIRDDGSSIKNILSNLSDDERKLVMKTTGASDFSKINKDNLKVGYGYDSRPYIRVIDDEGKSTNIPISVESLRSPAITSMRFQNVSKLFDEMKDGNSSVRSLMNKNIIKKTDSGNYRINVSDDLFNLPGGQRYNVPEFTKEEIESGGLSNSRISKTLNFISDRFAAHAFPQAAATVDIQPTKAQF